MTLLPGVSMVCAECGAALRVTEDAETGLECPNAVNHGRKGRMEATLARVIEMARDMRYSDEFVGACLRRALRGG